MFALWHGIFVLKKKSKKLERIQERALRFVYDDYSSSSETLLENAKVPILQVRRIRTMALETYKILHNLAPVCLQNLLHTKISIYYFRYRNILDVPQVRPTTKSRDSEQTSFCARYSEKSLKILKITKNSEQIVNRF
jgi:hypothetical protein